MKWFVNFGTDPIDEPKILFLYLRVGVPEILVRVRMY